MFSELKFRTAISESFKNYIEAGAHSIKKLKPIHGFVAETVKQIFVEKYFKIHYQGEKGSKERKVKGKITINLLILQ